MSTSLNVNSWTQQTRAHASYDCIITRDHAFVNYNLKFSFCRNTAL